jgi:hypothetical protein
MERYGPEQGMPSEISYRVRYYHDGGFVDYNPVFPSHRRPSVNTEIVAARAGDPCFIVFEYGTSPKFIIFESLIAEAC